MRFVLICFFGLIQSFLLWRTLKLLKTGSFTRAIVFGAVKLLCYIIFLPVIFKLFQLFAVVLLLLIIVVIGVVWYFVLEYCKE